MGEPEAAGRLELRVLARVVVDEAKTARPLVEVGQQMCDKPIEDHAVEGVGEKDYRGAIRDRLGQRVAIEQLDRGFAAQPTAGEVGLGLLVHALRQLDADQAPKRKASGDEQGPAIAGADIVEHVALGRCEPAEDAPKRGPADRPVDEVRGLVEARVEFVAQQRRLHVERSVDGELHRGAREAVGQADSGPERQALDFDHR